MIDIEIDISGALQDINKSVKDYEITLGKKILKAADYIAGFIEDNIIHSKDYRGGKLKENAQSTINSKGFDYPLIKTHSMAGGIKVFKINELEYEIGFTDKKDIYAKYLHSGTGTGKGKIPARPVIGVSTLLKNKVKEIVNG